MILDKFVLGLLIVVAGFVLDSILDRNRAEMALQNEIARVRVDKVGVVWGALDRQQLLAETLLSVSRGGGCALLRYVEFDRIRRQLARGHTEFRRLLATNRFWLGEALYSATGRIRPTSPGFYSSSASRGRRCLKLSSQTSAICVQHQSRRHDLGALAILRRLTG